MEETVSLSATLNL